MALVNLTFLEYFSSLNFYLLNKCLGVPLILLLEVILSRVKPLDRAISKCFRCYPASRFAEFDTFVICHVFMYFRLISMARYVFKTLQASTFEGQNMKFTVNMLGPALLRELPKGSPNG